MPFKFKRFPAIANGGLCAALLLFAGCARPAQIGADESVFGEVDALYTAVTSKRPDLLQQSFHRLTELHESGKVPDAAFQQLSGIRDQAERDEWRPAAEKLWHFMRGQRKTT